MKKYYRIGESIKKEISGKLDCVFEESELVEIIYRFKVKRNSDGWTGGTTLKTNKGGLYKEDWHSDARRGKESWTKLD